MGAAALEALCLVHPTVNFALTDSDCVPTSLFEVAELVNLMTDKATRAEAMQHHNMASSNQFFSVRRLLGSRQVVTQCLCHLNELCNVLHVPSLGYQKRAWTSTQSNMSIYMAATGEKEQNHAKPANKEPPNKHNKQKTENTNKDTPPSWTMSSSQNEQLVCR